MHIYNKSLSPTNEVTRLLLNPEQALKKNLKPIKMPQSLGRKPLRSLFSTKHALKYHDLHLSMQKETGQSQNLLQMSYDRKTSPHNYN